MVSARGEGNGGLAQLQLDRRGAGLGLAAADHQAHAAVRVLDEI